MTQSEEIFKLQCQKDELIKLLRSVRDRISNPLGVRERMYLLNTIDQALDECSSKL